MSRGGAADTIFALSSGAPPAAIAIIRVSGPDAGVALRALAGKLPPPRRASLRPLRHPSDGSLLDRALVLWNPGRATATGEDIAELQCHGGRAVVAAVLAALGTLPGLRLAEPGEFTRRAFENGRIDLAEAEGLADLLTAETEMQRRAAMANTAGGLSRLVDRWREQLIAIAAVVEARIEYEDDDDTVLTIDPTRAMKALAAEIETAIANPPAERMRDGICVVIAGPPNAGKSSLLNALAGRGAALVSEVPGTTRDIIEVPVAIEGLPFLLCDTAGVRGTTDPIEALGIAAAHQRMPQADILLWLGPNDDLPQHPRSLRIAAKADLPQSLPAADFRVSVLTRQGLDELRVELVRLGNSALSHSATMLNMRQQLLAGRALSALNSALATDDPLIIAEELRDARFEVEAVTGGGGVEDTLSAVFSRFCIGK